jgi:DNA adenine methylase
MVNSTQGKSILSWIGGKSLLAKEIIPLMPDHQCYCEVFAGAAWILFKKEPSKAEILNDINTDLVTLYRVIKHHLDEFIRYFKWILVAREEFERFRAENPETLTDIQRAVRFYYLVKTAHGSRAHKPTFGVSTTTAPRRSERFSGHSICGRCRPGIRWDRRTGGIRCRSCW